MPPFIEAVTRPDRLRITAQRRPAARSWFEIRNAASDDTAELLIYDEIGGWLGWYADEFVEQLAGITAPNLTVRINSPGGSVFEGIAIANALRSHPAMVTTQVDGIAASIASVIALAGDRLVMMPNSQLMIHDASGLCMGDAADMAQMATLLEQQSDNLADVYAAKAGGTRAEWRARMQAETWYLAAEAVEAGLADEVGQPTRTPGPPPVVPLAPDPDEAMAAHWDLSVFRYAGREEAPAPAATIATVVEPPPAAVVEPAPEPVAVTDETPGAPEPVPAEPVDDWASTIAHLNAPDPEPDWSASIAHLTDLTLTPSSATTNA
ncbi:head maturation protease, ClpP-related [Streptomyces sp. NPDC002506]|uniref:head maturation protease, ClpP-related n=1 Tax=Streptomyces sp. NPDC002506 TaxID=3154536 RepID=UPI0033262A49